MADLPCETSLAGAFKALFLAAEYRDAVAVRGLVALWLGGRNFLKLSPELRNISQRLRRRAELMELASADHRRYRILAVPVRPTAS
jgi:hypothetical protein